MDRLEKKKKIWHQHLRKENENGTTTDRIRKMIIESRFLLALVHIFLVGISPIKERMKIEGAQIEI